MPSSGANMAKNRDDNLEISQPIPTPQEQFGKDPGSLRQIDKPKSSKRMTKGVEGQLGIDQLPRVPNLKALQRWWKNKLIIHTYITKLE